MQIPTATAGTGPPTGPIPAGEFDLSTIGNAISNFVTTVVNGVANAVGRRCRGWAAVGIGALPGTPGGAAEAEEGASCLTLSAGGT